MAEQKNINWTTASTLIAVAILVGTELVGASWAAGWALGGMFQLGAGISHVIQTLFILVGFIGLYYFMRTALAHESFWR